MLVSSLRSLTRRSGLEEILGLIVAKLHFAVFGQVYERAVIVCETEALKESSSIYTEN